jgi:hypothetical protein
MMGGLSWSMTRHGGLLIPMMMLHDDPEIGPQPSPSALPLKIFFDMRRVELQIPSSPDAADSTLLHPCV